MSGNMTARQRAIFEPIMRLYAATAEECGGKDRCSTEPESCLCRVTAMRLTSEIATALDGLSPEPEGLGWLIEAKAPADSPLAGASLYLTLDGIEPAFGLDPNQAIRLQRESDAVLMANFFKLPNVTAVPFLFGATKQERTDDNEKAERTG